MESQAKLNENFMSFGTLYLKFWRYFYKKYKIQQLVYQFIYLLFYIASAFTSADTIFYNFLDPNPTFSEKRFPLTPLTSKIR